MEVIRDRDGTVISSRKDLRGIREYVGGSRAPVIKTMDLSQVGEGEGKLGILFMDGSSFETLFPSFTGLCQWVRRWRNTYGAPLLINGQYAGIMGYHNPQLTRLCR